MENIKKLIYNQYDIATIVSIDQIGNGIQKVYMITTKTLKYVLRLRDEQDIEHLECEIVLQNILLEQGLPCEKPIISHSEDYIINVIVDNLNYCGVLYEYIEGTKVGKIQSVEEAFLTGKEIGKMHDIWDDCESSIEELSYDELIWKPWNRIKKILRADDELYKFYEKRINRVYNKIKRLGNKLSWGICHGDGHLENVIFTKDHAACFFDFELICKTWRVYDLATFLWSILPREDYSEEAVQGFKNIWNQFILGYKNYRNMTDDETSLIFDFIILRHMWRQAERIQNESDNPIWQSVEHFRNQMDRILEWEKIFQALSY